MSFARDPSQRSRYCVGLVLFPLAAVALLARQLAQAEGVNWLRHARRGRAAAARQFLQPSRSRTVWLVWLQPASSRSRSCRGSAVASVRKSRRAAHPSALTEAPIHYACAALLKLREMNNLHSAVASRPQRAVPAICNQ
jgi:hypothetical protein